MLGMVYEVKIKFDCNVDIFDQTVQQVAPKILLLARGTLGVVRLVCSKYLTVHAKCVCEGELKGNKWQHVDTCPHQPADPVPYVKLDIKT